MSSAHDAGDSARPGSQVLGGTEREHRCFLRSLPPRPGPARARGSAGRGRLDPGAGRGTHGLDGPRRARLWESRSARFSGCGRRVFTTSRAGATPTARPATFAEGRWTKTTAVPLEPGVSLRPSPARGVTPTRHTRTREAGRRAATCSVTPPPGCDAPASIRPGPQAHHFRVVERLEPRRIVKRCSGAPDEAILGSDRLARTRSGSPPRR